MNGKSPELRYNGKKSFNKFFEFLSENGMNSYFRIVSDDDLNNFIKELAPVKLPKAYVEFMHYAGYGEFFAGSEYNLSRAAALNGYANELLEENNFPHRLPDNAFVFWLHQGYMFYFFMTGEGDDPAVYCYDECRELSDFVKCYDSFTDFIIEPYVTGVPRPL